MLTLILPFFYLLALLSLFFHFPGISSLAVLLFITAHIPLCLLRLSFSGFEVLMFLSSSNAGDAEGKTDPSST
jgi:hypothetical protein